MIGSVRRRSVRVDLTPGGGDGSWHPTIGRVLVCLQLGPDHLAQCPVEPFRPSFQGQLPAGDRCGSSTGEATYRMVHPSGIPLPKREDDPLPVRSQPFHRHVEDSDTVTHLR